MRLPRITVAALWTFVAVALPVLGATLAPISTVDLAYQVRAGDLMLAGSGVLRTDPFTFTAGGQPWLDQQWAAQLLFASAFRVGGWAGLAMLRALLVGLAFGFILVACRSAGAGARTAAALTLGGFLVALPSLALRPQLLGIVLFAATVLLVAGRQRTGRAIWLVPVIVVAWANIHGSFFLGPASLAAAWLADVVARRRSARLLAAIGLTSLAATLASPFGIEAWTYALGLTTNATIGRLVSEWQRTSPMTITGAVFFASVVIVVVALVAGARRGHRVPWPDVAWLGALAFLGAYAERGVAWWALGAPVAIAPLVARLAARAPAAVSRRAHASAANTVVAAALGISVVALQPAWRAGDPLTGPAGLLVDAPREVALAVAESAGPNDRIFAPQRWGSWLEWAAPGRPLMVDSRIEVIPEAAWTDYFAIAAAAPGWEALLDRWNITVIVIDARGMPGLLAALRGSAAWAAVEGDPDGAVYRRSR